jgi:hypothetical protein
MGPGGAVGAPGKDGDVGAPGAPGVAVSSLPASLIASHTVLDSSALPALCHTCTQENTLSLIQAS